jgi:acetoin utilization protein AcuC
MSGVAASVLVIRDRETAAYGFSGGHPFGPDRHDAFHAELERSGVRTQVVLGAGRAATRQELEAFHAADYLDMVRERCAAGTGFLDGGDTPAERGLNRAAGAVVGAVIAAGESIMAGDVRRAFVPIAGLHHAGRTHAAGFCVFNDCGVLIELLRSRFGLQRIAYVDIDAHHGDGVFYAFEDDPAVLIADIHEDGRYLYPGTGAAHETGTGAARDTKLNIPLPPGAGDPQFRAAWERVEAYLDHARPEFIVFQCGADSLAGDPITHLQYTPAAHGYAAARLCALADRHCGGRLLGTGGGGYNRRNLALAWTAVVRAFAAADEPEA